MNVVKMQAKAKKGRKSCKECKGVFCIHDSCGKDPAKLPNPITIAEQSMTILENLLKENENSPEQILKLGSKSELLGMAPVCVVAAMGHIEGMRRFLVAGSEVNENTSTDGSTPLMLAAQNRHIEVVELLLKHGADVTAVNEDGNNSFMIAVRTGDAKLVNIMWAYRGNLDIDHKNVHGCTALHIAADKIWEGCVQFLIANHAEINKINLAGWTPLMLASMKGDLKTVERLVTSGANILIEDYMGYTAVCWAIENDKDDVITFLLDNLDEHGIENFVKNRIERLRNPFDDSDSEDLYEDILIPLFERLSKLESFRDVLYQQKIMAQIPLAIQKHLKNSELVLGASRAIATLIYDNKDANTNERFVQQFVRSRGPDVFMRAMKMYSDSNKLVTDSIVALFLPFLCMIDVQEGKEWLERNSTKIVSFNGLRERIEFFKFHDKKTRETAITIWRRFWEYFEKMLKCQRDQKMNELLEEEERERSRKMKKREKRKQKRQRQHQFKVAKEQTTENKTENPENPRTLEDQEVESKSSTVERVPKGESKLSDSIENNGKVECADENKDNKKECESLESILDTVNQIGKCTEEQSESTWVTVQGKKMQERPLKTEKNAEDGGKRKNVKRKNVPTARKEQTRDEFKNWAEVARSCPTSIEETVQNQTKTKMDQSSEKLYDDEFPSLPSSRRSSDIGISTISLHEDKVIPCENCDDSDACSSSSLRESSDVEILNTTSHMDSEDTDEFSITLKSIADNVLSTNKDWFPKYRKSPTPYKSQTINRSKPSKVDVSVADICSQNTQKARNIETTYGQNEAFTGTKTRKRDTRLDIPETTTEHLPEQITTIESDESKLSLQFMLQNLFLGRQQITMDHCLPDVESMQSGTQTETNERQHFPIKEKTGDGFKGVNPTSISNCNKVFISNNKKATSDSSAYEAKIMPNDQHVRHTKFKETQQLIEKSNEISNQKNNQSSVNHSFPDNIPDKIVDFDEISAFKDYSAQDIFSVNKDSTNVTSFPKSDKIETPFSFSRSSSGPWSSFGKSQYDIEISPTARNVPRDLTKFQPYSDNVAVVKPIGFSLDLIDETPTYSLYDSSISFPGSISYGKSGNCPLGESILRNAANLDTTPDDIWYPSDLDGSRSMSEPSNETRSSSGTLNQNHEEFTFPSFHDITKPSATEFNYSCHQMELLKYMQLQQYFNNFCQDKYGGNSNYFHDFWYYASAMGLTKEAIEQITGKLEHHERVNVNVGEIQSKAVGNHLEAGKFGSNKDSDNLEQSRTNRCFERLNPQPRDNQNVARMMNDFELLSSHQIGTFKTTSQVTAVAQSDLSRKQNLKQDYSTSHTGELECSIEQSGRTFQQKLSQNSSENRTSVLNTRSTIKWSPRSKRWRDKLSEILKLPPIFRTQVGNIVVPVNCGDRFTIFYSDQPVQLGFLTDGSEVAVQSINLTAQCITPEFLQSLTSSAMSHYFLVKYKSYAIDADDHCYLAMDLHEYTVDEYMQMLQLNHQSDSLSVNKLAWQVLKGLSSLHDNCGIAHGNIMPSNTLVDVDGKVRLSEYGFPRKDTSGKQLLVSHCPLTADRLCWTPTEVMTETSEYSIKSDIQVAGMLLYFILTGGSHPFGGSNSLEIQCGIHHHWYNMVYIVDEANHLLSEMIKMPPAERPTVTELMRHPYFWANEKRLRFVLIVGSDVLRDLKLGVPTTGGTGNTMIDIMNAICCDEPFSDWITDIDPMIMKEMRSFRQYKNTLVELVLFIYNCCLHFDKLSPVARDIVDEPCRYFLTKFPTLFMCVYRAIKGSPRQEKTCYKPFF